MTFDRFELGILKLSSLASGDTFTFPTNIRANTIDRIYMRMLDESAGASSHIPCVDLKNGMSHQFDKDTAVIKLNINCTVMIDRRYAIDLDTPL